jgi:hypothetical protein
MGSNEYDPEQAVQDVSSQHLEFISYEGTVTDLSSYTNIMFICSSVETQVVDRLFSDYCNSNTYPLVYDYITDRQSIVDFLASFPSNNIKRISFVFHGPRDVPSNTNTSATYFLNNELLFTEGDLLENPTTLSDNVMFVKELISQFSLENIDFLGCNLLNLDSYNKYFELLKSCACDCSSNVIIGASDDNTGNIKYGGDWTLESSMENIKSVYFNDTIDNYSSLLATITVNGINYNIVGADVHVGSNSGATGAIIIPSTVTDNGTTYNVVAIANNAFQGSSLTSITIPASVTSILNYVFAYVSSLSSVTFEAGSQLTSIGQQAFMYTTSLTSITIPAGVTTIGKYAFNNATNLTSINLPAGLTRISDYTFSNATILTSIIIPASVTSIGLWAFRGTTSLTSVTLSSSLLEIGNEAFMFSDINSVTIPASVTSIGIAAFRQNVNLSSLTFEENSQLASIGNLAFYKSLLSSLNIPESVTSIGNSAFGLSPLASITVDPSNTSYKDISNALFDFSEENLLIYAKNSTSTTYEIPASVTNIHQNAFYQATNLTAITFETA